MAKEVVVDSVKSWFARSCCAVSCCEFCIGNRSDFRHAVVELVFNNCCSVQLLTCSVSKTAAIDIDSTGGILNIHVISACEVHLNIGESKFCLCS